MNEKNSNLVISLLSIIAAVIMLLALSFAIGKWSFGTHGHLVHVVFPSIAGIDTHSEVKMAGAPAGHVVAIAFIPKANQTVDKETGLYNYVMVTAELNDDVEIGDDFTSIVKQDGLSIAPKYLLFMPGRNHNAPPLPDGGTIQGQTPFDLTDLAQPIGTALQKANHMLDELGDSITKLQPIADKLGPLADSLNVTLTEKLPPLLDRSEKLVDQATRFLGDYDTPGYREHLSKLLVNLGVVTDNLKVVTSNSKAFTATLAEKPWRLLFGGKTILPPSEDEILLSNRPLPSKGNVSVEGESSKPVKVPPHHLAPPIVSVPVTPIP